ncbi:hypothetical protein DL98DRAFT_521904 [Cadophora sp. DSE1049]|nr:hypothetical protein DL98DRAFT_521904 [Cadophora sp. DSE1049]
MGKHRENLWKWFSKDGRAIAPPRTLSESTQTSLINLTERHLPPDVPAQVGSTNAGPQPLVNDARLALTSAGPLQSVSASTVQETSNTSSSRATLMHFLPSVLHVAGASSKNDHGGYFPEVSLVESTR